MQGCWDRTPLRLTQVSRSEVPSLNPSTETAAPPRSTAELGHVLYPKAHSARVSLLQQRNKSAAAEGSPTDPSMKPVGSWAQKDRATPIQGLTELPQGIHRDLRVSADLFLQLLPGEEVENSLGHHLQQPGLHGCNLEGRWSRQSGQEGKDEAPRRHAQMGFESWPAAQGKAAPLPTREMAQQVLLQEARPREYRGEDYVHKEMGVPGPQAGPNPILQGLAR